MMPFSPISPAIPRCQLALLAALWVLLHCLMIGQQPNTPQVSLRCNGVDGPPWPISVDWRTSLEMEARLSGAPNARFVMAIADRVQIPGQPALGGLLDLDLGNSAVLFDGFAMPAAATLDLSSRWSFRMALPATTPVGRTAAIQAAIEDFAAPAGFFLTAATRLSATEGPTIRQLSLSNDSFLPIVLPSGWTIPFYGGNYTFFFVNSNGSISFEGGHSDPSATPAELRAGVPQIAGYWTNLDPSLSGTVRLTFEPIPQPTVRLDFDQVADASGPAGTINGFLQSFSLEIDAGPMGGGFRMIYPSRSGPSIYPVVIGFTPGRNRDQQASLNDLSLIGAGGALTTLLPMEGVAEWFGDPIMVGYGLPQPNPFDLRGRTFTVIAAQPGTPQAFYVLY